MHAPVEGMYSSVERLYRSATSRAERWIQDHLAARIRSDSQRFAGGMAMSVPLRVVHYVNQFFGGIGGEDQADVGVTVKAGAVGPGRVLEKTLGDGARVEATLIGGDNFVNERAEEASRVIAAELDRLKPDVLIAGPAFGSGRYGLACALACKVAQAQGVPAITAMHPENPGASSARREIYVVPTGASTTSMQAALDALAPLARRLGSREALGPAEVDGYLPRGQRRVHDRGRPGYQRALDMLLDKLHGRPYRSEVPDAAPERVAPAPPIADLSRARIAMVTTGGLVRKGNPDRQVSANAVRYHRHTVAELESLSPADWEAYHAGYFNHLVNSNPNYILPLSFLRDLERVCGDPTLSPEKDYAFGMRIVTTALQTLTIAVPGPTLFDPMTPGKT